MIYTVEYPSFVTYGAMCVFIGFILGVFISGMFFYKDKEETLVEEAPVEETSKNYSIHDDVDKIVENVNEVDQ